MAYEFIWQHDDWPRFSWDSERLLTLVGKCRGRQGHLLATMEGLGLEAARKAQADIMVCEAITTSEIEEIHLPPSAVRSSVARRLGLPDAGLGPSDRHAEGLVDILFDAAQNFDAPMNQDRLFSWHAALFPTGYSGLKKITVGGWRPVDEPMRVVSGPVGKERVHYVAPDSSQVPQEMQRFFEWWEHSRDELDGLLRAGVAHLYFVSIHPFQDGNGRIARALTDLAMAQDERTDLRCYSLSAQMRQERQSYYKALETAQRGTSDTTGWLEWFLQCFAHALEASEQAVAKALIVRKFWERFVPFEVNERQRKALNKLLEAGPDGFEGGLSNKKYRAMTKTSAATATRDLTQLVEWGILRKTGEGRSVRYEIRGLS